MAKPRRQTKKRDEFVSARDLFGKQNMWPTTREELIERQRPCKDEGYQVLAVAVCGTPPVGEEPHGDTDEWIWMVEEVTPMTTGCEPYRRISVSRIVNPRPGCWLAHWSGGEGTSRNLFCPPEFFALVPVVDAAWRAVVEANPDRPAPSMMVISPDAFIVEGGAS